MTCLIGSLCPLMGQGETDRDDSCGLKHASESSWSAGWIKYFKSFMCTKTDLSNQLGWTNWETMEGAISEMMSGSVKLYSFTAALSSGVAFAWLLVKGWRKVLEMFSPGMQQLGQESDRPDRESDHDIIMKRPDVMKGLPSMYGEGRGQIQELFISKGNRRVMAIGLRARWVLTYGHGMQDMDLKDGDLLTVTFKNLENQFAYRKDLVRNIPSQDMTIIWIDAKTLPNFKDITSRLKNGMG